MPWKRLSSQLPLKCLSGVKEPIPCKQELPPIFFDNFSQGKFCPKTCCIGICQHSALTFFCLMARKAEIAVSWRFLLVYLFISTDKKGNRRRKMFTKALWLPKVKSLDIWLFGEVGSLFSLEVCKNGWVSATVWDRGSTAAYSISDFTRRLGRVP